MNYKNIIKTLKIDRTLSDRSKIAIIKRDVDSKDYKKALESFPLLNAVLKRNAFFKNINSIIVKTPYYFTASVEKETIWNLIQLINFSDKINLFIIKKNNFESNFILGKFNSCREILIDIENEFGISLWLLEAKLLLSTYEIGDEANWSLLSEFLHDIKNPFYEFNVSASSRRFEKNLSFESFFNQFSNDINSINSDNIVRDYFVFKNFSIAKYDYDFKNLEAVLFLSNIFSIIDLYLITIDILIHNFCSGLSIKYYDFITELNQVIKNDNRLTNLSNLINDTVGKENINKSLIESLDYYYSCNYESSLSISLEYIKKCPTEFEFYIIYVKSLISLDLDFINTSISDIIDEILESLYKVLLFNKDSRVYYNKLLKYSITFSDFSLGRRLASFMNEIDGLDNNIYYSGFFYSKFLIPQLLLINNKLQLNNNFDTLKNSLSYKVFLMKSGTSDHSKLLSGKTGLLILAEYHYARNEFKDVIDLLENFAEFPNYYIEKYINFLYKSYVKLQLFDEAITLYIKYYFDKELYFKKLDYHFLIDELNEKDDFLEHSDTLDFVIFSSFSLRDFDLYEILDEFLLTIDIFSIRDIDIDLFINKYSLEKVIYMIKNILIIDVIKYFDYDSIANVEEDRVYLLNKLIQIDPENREEYASEINNIYRSTAVRDVLNDVDEGRLYVDVENLQKQQVKKLNDDFRRFKEIETYSKSNTIIGFNPSNKRDWENAIKESLDYNSQYSSAEYLAFKNIYLESRNNFLYSKEYGLESCLSTRIRHGALKNHIRSVFEKLELITVKSGDHYQDNLKVLMQLQYNEEINQKVQNLLKEFSRNIDNINSNIIDKYMQISTENSKENLDGLFRYYTHDELLYDFYLERKHHFDSAESIIAIILENLVNFTLLDLTYRIVKFFHEDVFQEFDNLINHLILELKKLNLPSEMELLPNLIKSKTEIQKELEYISEWFFLSTDSSLTLLDTETILHASIALTNKINPLFVLRPEINIKNNAFAYSNFIFIYNILLNNIIIHSKIHVDDLKVKISVATSEDKKYTIVKFTNNLNPMFDYKENVTKLEKVKQNWNDHSNIERSNKEQGSGFDKIKRILIYEARAKTDKFDFEFTKNEMTIILYLPYSERKRDEQ